MGGGLGEGGEQVGVKRFHPRCVGGAAEAEMVSDFACAENLYQTIGLVFMLRSYHLESTRSHRTPEVKLSWAGLVLDSGMIWESPVS